MNHLIWFIIIFLLAFGNLFFIIPSFTVEFIVYFSPYSNKNTYIVNYMLYCILLKSFSYIVNITNLFAYLHSERNEEIKELMISSNILLFVLFLISVVSYILIKVFFNYSSVSFYSVDICALFCVSVKLIFFYYDQYKLFPDKLDKMDLRTMCFIILF